MTVFAALPEAMATERLELERIRMSDASALQEMTNDRSITDAISFLSYPFTLDAARAYIRNLHPARDRVFVARTKSGRVMVGIVGVHLNEGSRIEIGYWLGVAVQGQGYGREAVAAVLSEITRSCPDHRLFAECVPENRRSWRLLEKLGFETTEQDGARAGRKRLEYHKGE